MERGYLFMERNKINVFNADNQLQARMIQEILGNNGIDAALKQNGAGTYLNIFMGFSTYGIDILVEENEKEQAKKLIHDMMLEDKKSMVSIEKVPWYKNKVIVAKIILIFFLLGIIIPFIEMVIDIL